jgi:hypothetical protein
MSWLFRRLATLKGVAGASPADTAADLPAGDDGPGDDIPNPVGPEASEDAPFCDASAHSEVDADDEQALDAIANVDDVGDSYLETGVFREFVEHFEQIAHAPAGRSAAVSAGDAPATPFKVARRRNNHDIVVCLC